MINKILSRLRSAASPASPTPASGIKVLFPIVLCLLPAAMIFLWGPALVDLWRFFQAFQVPTLSF